MATFVVEDVFEIRGRGPCITRSPEASKIARDSDNMLAMGDILLADGEEARVVGIERHPVNGPTGLLQGGILLAGVAREKIYTGQVWTTLDVETEFWKWRHDAVREINDDAMYISHEEMRRLRRWTIVYERENTLRHPGAPPRDLLTGSLGLVLGLKVVIDPDSALDQAERIMRSAVHKASADALADLPQPGEPTMNLLHPEVVGIGAFVRQIFRRKETP